MLKSCQCLDSTVQLQLGILEVVVNQEALYGFYSRVYIKLKRGCAHYSTIWLFMRPSCIYMNHLIDCPVNVLNTRGHFFQKGVTVLPVLSLMCKSYAGCFSGVHSITISFGLLQCNWLNLWGVQHCWLYRWHVPVSATISLLLMQLFSDQNV